MPFGMGWPELTIILVIVLIIFGASRVPEVGRAIGSGIREFRRTVTGSEDDAASKSADAKDAQKEGAETAEKR